MVTEQDLDSYLNDLEEILNTDINICDINLLEILLECLDTRYELVVEGNLNTSIFIDLYIEDIKDKKGPFKIPCMPSWTGKTFKEKCNEYFKFPVKSQTLLRNSERISDEQTLFSAGVRHCNDVLCVFLMNRSRVKQQDQTRTVSYRSETSRKGSDSLNITAHITERSEGPENGDATDVLSLLPSSF